LGEAAGSSCPAAISGCAAAVNRGGYRACGRGSRCARCSARRCARNGWRQSAPRRRSPSVIAALPPPPLAENLPRLPSPTARPAPISLRSSGPLSVQVEVSQLHLTAWPDGHLNDTHPYTAERPENSTTSVDANAADGYVAQIPLALLPGKDASAGPFYLIWQYPERSQVANANAGVFPSRFVGHRPQRSHCIPKAHCEPAGSMKAFLTLSPRLTVKCL